MKLTFLKAAFCTLALLLLSCGEEEKTKKNHNDSILCVLVVFFYLDLFFASCTLMCIHTKKLHLRDRPLTDNHI
jgi:hypothetical protein